MIVAFLCVQIYTFPMKYMQVLHFLTQISLLRVLLCYAEMTNRKKNPTN